MFSSVQIILEIHLFCGPSPTKYSITLSTAPRSRGRIGLARGGPGGWRPTIKEPEDKCLMEADIKEQSCFITDINIYLTELNQLEDSLMFCRCV